MPTPSDQLAAAKKEVEDTAKLREVARQKKLAAQNREKIASEEAAARRANKNAETNAKGIFPF